MNSPSPDEPDEPLEGLEFGPCPEEPSGLISGDPQRIADKLARGSARHWGGLTTDPKVHGGITVFTGTDVPLHVFFEYIAAGRSVEDFSAEFPSVHAEAARAVIAMLEAEDEKAAGSADADGSEEP